MHLERNPEVKNDPLFFAKICQLTTMADTFVIKNLERLNMHEFTTIVIYYLNHHDVCSKQLRKALLNKMGDAVTHFNEY